MNGVTAICRVKRLEWSESSKALYKQGVMFLLKVKDKSRWTESAEIWQVKDDCQKKKLPTSTKSEYKHKTTNKITQVPSSVLLLSGSTDAVLKIIAVSKKKKMLWQEACQNTKREV